MRALVVLVLFAVLGLLAVHVLRATAAPAPRAVDAVAPWMVSPSTTAPKPSGTAIRTPANKPAPSITSTTVPPGQTKIAGRRCWSMIQPPDGQACPQPTDQACAGSPLEIGQCMAARRGWFDGPGTGNEWSCVSQLGTEESNWNPTAKNLSGAYGIPQALPGSKMAQAGLDWWINPRTQLVWMYDDYIVPNYGTPCAAQAFHQAHGWW
jgi:hypothetical protein